MHKGDIYILLLLVAVFAVWFLVAFVRWLQKPIRRTLQIDESQPLIWSDIVDLLQEQGYDVLSDKQNVPLEIDLDGERKLRSHLQVDYIVKQRGMIYLVKLAKPHQPVEMNGASIRDHLLIYQLLYEEVDGILYIDTQEHIIHKIHVEIDNRKGRFR